MGAKNDTLENRLWRRVQRTVDGCWPWMGSRGPYGHGCISKGSHKHKTRKMVKTHRVAYESANGPIPEDMDVCHTCDWGACCRPSHLFLGNDAINLKDAAIKGRMHLKLPNEMVPLVRAAVGSEPKIAAQFGISRAMVGAIRRGERRQHV